MVRSYAVALLAEGVDRNLKAGGQLFHDFGSPSSRRAWIEILSRQQMKGKNPSSPSSRRAWIEIKYDPPTEADADVALLAEGVDRNFSSIRLIPLSE